MKALVVEPGQANSAMLRDMPSPERGDGILVETLQVGVCGTDREIIAGNYGTAPPGSRYLIIGHESLGRVVEAPAESQLSAGDLVVGIVRNPDPVPCENCAAGEWDMCRNGRYTEHGIKGLHGFCGERFRVSPDHAVRIEEGSKDVAVLLEPTSVVAKAWDHIDRIGARSVWSPKRVLVTGAGPIGLLAALLGTQRGLEVHVLDRVEGGPKPQLVEALGAIYHSGNSKQAGAGADIVLECTGTGQLVFDVMQSVGPNGIVCLTGISSGQRKLAVDLAGLNREMVLENNVVFGSVNANRRHYVLAAAALAHADPNWLSRLITRRVPIDDWRKILERPPDDIKTVIEFS